MLYTVSRSGYMRIGLALLVAAILLSGCVTTLPGVMPVAVQTTGDQEAANKEFILDYFAALNEDKSPATVDAYMTDEVLKEHIAMFEASFPGYQLTAEEMIAEGDKIFVRTLFDAVHNGDLMGIAPTEKPVSIEIALIYQIQDGKIVDHWMLADLLTLMQQIGAAPGPEATE